MTFRNDRLTSMTVLRESPPSANAAGSLPSSVGVIYVPASAVDAYKAADGWKNFASKIQSIQE